MGHEHLKCRIHRLVGNFLLPSLLLIGSLASPAVYAGTAADAAAKASSQAAITRLVVRFRPGVQPAAGEVIGAALWADLQATTGDALGAVSTTRTGDQVISFAHPADAAEVRRVLGALRMRPDVLWAEPDRSERSAAANARLKRKSADERANINHFIVVFTDPDLATMARNNGRPGPEWDDLLSTGAGVPMRVLRATVGGAWIVETLTAVTASRAEALAEKLQATPGIQSASPDYPARSHAYFPNDTYFRDGHQRDLADPQTTIYFGIDAPEAWDITVGSDLVVAVVDTGVRPHVDFSSRMLSGYTFISNPSRSHDGLGRHAGGQDPGDWAAKDECGAGEAAEDSGWHGTHVTGTIAANADNGEGIAGINWYSTILPVRVLGTCGGSSSDIIEGMSWAAGLPVPGIANNPNPARVINMSLGGPGPCSLQYQSAINQVLAAGTFIAVSGGNDSEDIEGSHPANCFGVSTVAATDPYGYLASYSNFGLNVDISAPGGDKSRYGSLYGIWSTLNSGKMTPEFSTYGAYQGTSMASPHVAGVASLMLSVNPALTPAQIKSIMGATSSYFATDSICRTDGTCGPGIVNAYYAVKEALRVAPNNYDGLWWAAPGGIESGWGINFSHQGDVIFATWFTYDGSGKAWWLSMTASKVGENVYSGALYQTRGPPFNAVPFTPAAVSATQVGVATLSFANANAASFNYSVGGIAQSKTITRQVFGPLPRCTFGALNSLALATNYQGLWWNAPGGSESGWGVNITQEGNVLFGTWFTYDLDGTPLWLSVTANYLGGTTYSGTLYRTTGPAFNSVPFNPAGVTATPVGAATFSFANGNAANFGYTFRGVTQTKVITRQVFRAPGTACE